jgi:hypothetical protein
MRMLYCPFLSPFSSSRRLPGQHGGVAKRDSRFQTIQLEPTGTFAAGERLYPLAKGKISGPLVAVTEDHSLS